MSMRLKMLRVSANQLEAYKNNIGALKTRMQGDPEEDYALITLDKAWEGVLFLLTGQGLRKNKHPLARILFSEQVVDEELDMGYGPVEYLLPDEVQTLSAEIAPLTPEVMATRFDADKMTALYIYPEIWHEEGAVEYVVAFYMELKDFFARAANNNEVIITGLT